MARKADSGWRDLLLDNRHDYYGFDFPVAGMMLPMIEYDRGNAVGLVSYHRWGVGLPKGSDATAAHQAFGNVHSARDGSQLPFLTAVYDAEHWTMKLFAHNDAARLLIGTGWQQMTEREFVKVLYRMRNRELPDLSRHGIEWNTAGETWSDHKTVERWPGQAMSQRRRWYEPTVSIPFKQRIPCTDIDFAVVDVDQRLALVVDYKRSGTERALAEKNTNLRALASLQTKRGLAIADVAAMVVEYAPTEAGWAYTVYPMNASAASLLSYVLGGNGVDIKRLADAIVGTGWVNLSETEWRDVLKVARGV